MWQRTDDSDVRADRSKSDGGFVLVAVIWIATLLAVIAFIFTAAVRSTLRSATIELAIADAEASADAGVNLAIFDMVAPRDFGAEPRFAINGPVHSCRAPSGGIVAVRIRDEAGRIDLNVANDGLLEALLIGLGLPAEVARERVAAIADFKDDDDDKRDGGTEREAYAAAGLAFGPKNAPFETVDELARVIGFNSELVRTLRPYLTVNSQQDGVDPAAAAPELGEILSRGSRESALENFSSLEASSAIPPQFTVQSARRNYSIWAEARSPRGAVFVREAMVSLIDRTTTRRSRPGLGETVERRDMPYRLWQWRRGESLPAAQAAADPVIEDC